MPVRADVRDPRLVVTALRILAPVSVRIYLGSGGDMISTNVTLHWATKDDPALTKGVTIHTYTTRD
jgi:hypothetical protein